jgi:two-component system cell cycle response regulator DivK
MDIAMPGMDGYTAARLMRAQPLLQNVPMVAVSATSVATREMASEAGFDGYYPLPIDPEQFVALLEPFLSSSPERRQATSGETEAARTHPSHG